VIERNGEGYAVRASGRVETMGEIGDIVVATRRCTAPGSLDTSLI
jgi:Cu/Ag efflux pump CusA